jgi:hypothetical protein
MRLVLQYTGKANSNSCSTRFHPEEKLKQFRNSTRRSLYLVFILFAIHDKKYELFQAKVSFRNHRNVPFSAFQTDDENNQIEKQSK